MFDEILTRMLSLDCLKQVAGQLCDGRRENEKEEECLGSGSIEVFVLIVIFGRLELARCKMHMQVGTCTHFRDRRSFVREVASHPTERHVC